MPFQKSSIYKQFFIAFLILGVIPLVIAFVHYQNARELTTQLVTESYASQLELGKRLLVQQLRELEVVTLGLADDDAITGAMSLSAPLSGTAPLRLVEAAKRLTGSYATGELVSRLWVYYPGLDSISGTDRNYPRFGTYYGEIYAIEGYTYPEAREQLLLAERTGELLSPVTVVNPKGSERVIPYVRGVPLHNPSGPEASILALLRQRAVLEVFSDLHEYEDAFFVMRSPDGTVLAETSGGADRLAGLQLEPDPAPQAADLETADGNTFVFRTYTDRPVPIEFVFGLPRDVAMAPFLSVGRIALISLAAALLIHIAMSGFVSRRLADPVVNAIRRLSREDQGALGPADPSYKDLNALLDRTFDRTTDLEDRLAEQRKTLSEAFFEMVLHGTVHKKDLPERVASELGMASASRFRVMLCRILVSDELTDQVEILSRSALYVRKTVEDSPRVRVFSARPDVVGFVVYETEDVDPAARIFDVSKRLARDTDPLEEVGILVTVGGEAHDILEIHRSYEEAQAVFDAVSEHEGLEIFWYDNVPSKDEGYVLSPATLMSLSQALRHGRKDEIELIFDHIRRVNLDRKRITPAAASLLIRELWVNLAKTVQRVGIGREHQGEPLLEEASGELPPVLAKGSPVERLLSLRGYYVRCSELVPSAQSDSEPELVRDAKRYLEENFSRTDISLAMLADLFGVTPSHLSRSFSSSERTSFHVFLTHVRIEKAKAIIAQDPSSASAVYTEVGYTNQSTFRRAFQSYVGTTPVKYARLRSQDVRSGHS